MQVFLAPGWSTVSAVHLKVLSAPVEKSGRRVSERQNLAARQAMMLGACYAGQAFSNAPVAAMHAIPYPIHGVFHVPHGLSNALVLSHVLRFNASHAKAEDAELADIIATTLRQVGMTDDDLDRGNNPRTLKRADARAIYQAAL